MKKKIHGPLRKWQNWAFLTKLKKRKNPRSSHKMTKLSIFDKIEEAKKFSVLYQNDIIEHFWQNWRSKKYTGLSQDDKMGHFWQNWRSEKIHGPLTKWQNWAFLTKFKTWKKNTRASQKMTKLCIFDKIEEAKKSTVLSQNDKIEHFWQNWRSKKIHGPLTKWQNEAFLTKLKNRKNPRPSHKMTKLSIFVKIDDVKKKYTGLSENDKIEHFWQNCKSEKSIWGFLKWQNWGFLTKLKNRKKHTGFSENDKIEHFWQNLRSEEVDGSLRNDKILHFRQYWKIEK